MTRHTVGTRQEWLAARRALLGAEKELTHRGDEVTRQRQELPWVQIDKPYRFDTEQGSASLADLFRGRSQLLVYHFMFGPDYAAGCPACSAIAAFPLGAGLAELEMQHLPLARAVPIAAGAVVVLAGLLQFTAWKM